MIRPVKIFGWILWWACAAVLVVGLFVGSFKVYEVLNPETGERDLRADPGSASGVSLEEAVGKWKIPIPQGSTEIHFSYDRHPLGQGDSLSLTYTANCAAGRETIGRKLVDAEFHTPFTPNHAKRYAEHYGWLPEVNSSSGAVQEDGGAWREILIEQIDGETCRFYFDFFEG